MKLEKITVWLALPILAGFLSGCASDNGTGATVLTPGEVPPIYQVQGSLNEAAQQASAALSQLAAIKKAEHPSAPLPFLNLEDPALNTAININSYYGPIAQIVKTIGSQIGYQVQVFGKQPPTPILVDLQTQGPQTALQLLRNIDLQAQTNASMMILPKQKIISLRYMPS